MNFCPYCGSKLDSKALYCPACGKKLDIEKNIDRVKNHYENKKKNDPVVNEVVVKPKKRKKWAVLGLSFGFVALASTAIFIGVKNFGIGNLMKSKKIYKNLVWNNEGFQFVKDFSQEGSNAINISDVDYNGENVVSDNGKYFLFFKDIDYVKKIGTLCRAELDKFDENDTDNNDQYIVTIDSDVNIEGTLHCFNNGEVVYAKPESSSGTGLYYYNGKESRCFAGDVSTVHYLEEDYVIYDSLFSNEQDDYARYSLYYWEVGSEEDAVKFVDETSKTTFCDPEHIFYRVITDEESLTYSMYETGISSKEPTKIAENVYSDYADIVYENHTCKDFPYMTTEIKTEYLADYFSDSNLDEAYEENEHTAPRRRLYDDIQDVLFDKAINTLYEYVDGKSVKISEGVKKDDLDFFNFEVCGDRSVLYYEKAPKADKSLDIQKLLNLVGSYYDSNDLSSYGAEVVNESSDMSGNLYFSVNGGPEQAINRSSFEHGSDIEPVKVFLLDENTFGIVGRFKEELDKKLLLVSEIEDDKILELKTFDEFYESEFSRYAEHYIVKKDNREYLYEDNKLLVLVDDADINDIYAYEDGKIRYIQDMSKNGGKLTEVDYSGDRKVIADNVIDYVVLKNGDYLMLIDKDIKYYDGKDITTIVANADAKSLVIPSGFQLERYTNEVEFGIY